MAARRTTALALISAPVATLDVERHPPAANAWLRLTSLVSLAVCVAFSGPRTVSAQNGTNPWFARIGFSPAYVIGSNPFSVGDESWTKKRIGATPSVTFEMGRQTDGSRPWHHMYGLPSYGFGFSVASIADGVSRPIDAYTFFSWPFARLDDRVHLTTDFGMGVSWNWKAQDAGTDSYTTVLGSDFNALVDWGFYLRYIATPRMSMYAGLDYTHRSNGGMKQPDFGINVLGPRVALRYNLAPEHHQLPIRKPPPFRPAWEVVLGGAGGPKNVVADHNADIRHNFGAFDVTGDLQRQFYQYGKLASGTDVTYDGASGVRIDLVNGESVSRQSAFGDRLSLGFHGGYEHVIGRFSALVQIGYKVLNSSAEPSPPRLYERYGWRYQFDDRFYGTFAIRAVGHKADFLEFGVGYKKRWE